ncbi:MAG: GlsB/YeaQ/YmgE family stress response membrane protein [Candidatus Obscuribacterales bacterium]|nr:GlsB/YeaQ/YmgE family stress response membrane protein [Candidatus Obscuribacterales bacterium]
MGILAIICYLVVAAVCAFIAEKCVPGVIPGGFPTSAIVGVIGAWVGGNLLGSFGPNLAGIALVPCIVGSAILVFGLSLCSRQFNRRA